MVLMTSNKIDTAIEWIGEIPVNWTYCRFKDVVNLYVGNSIKDEDKDNYCDNVDARSYISSKDIDLSFNTINYDNGLYIKNYDLNFRIAPKFSTLMCIEGGSAGRKKAITLNDVSFVNKLCCFVPKNNDLDYKYLYYFLCSPNYEDYFFSQMTGLIGGVSISKLNDFNILLPPLKEQRNICKFLDNRITPIDEAIKESYSLINKYEDYKHSLTTEIVTRGLDDEVELEDSGVDWIGEIPKFWKLNKIKNLCYVKGRIGWQGLTSNEYSDEGAYLVTGTDFKDGRVDWDNCNHISYERYEQDPYIQLKEGDLLITKDGTIGKLALVKNIPDKTTLNSGIFLVRPLNNEYTNNYLYWVLYSNVFVNFFDYIKSGSTISHLYQKTFGDFTFPYPSIDKQIEISNYLNKRCNFIDSLIFKKQNLIDKLEEYKQSLIFEYVTGKKRVENEVKY